MPRATHKKSESIDVFQPNVNNYSNQANNTLYKNTTNNSGKQSVAMVPMSKQNKKRGESMPHHNKSGSDIQPVRNS